MYTGVDCIEGVERSKQKPRERIQIRKDGMEGKWMFRMSKKNGGRGNRGEKGFCDKRKKRERERKLKQGMKELKRMKYGKEIKRRGR